MSDTMNGQASLRRAELRELEASHLWILGLTSPERRRPATAPWTPPVPRDVPVVGSTRRDELRPPTWLTEAVRSAPGRPASGQPVSGTVPASTDPAECECPGDCLIDHELD